MKTIVLFLAVIPVFMIISCADYNPDSSKDTWKLPSTAEIRSLLERRMQNNGVGIVVGVIDKNGSRIITYGKTGAADNRPLNGDSVFQIGSITKVFTTLLLAHMVEINEVGLDDPAGNHMPSGVMMPYQDRAITLRDLATHTSGLPSLPDNFNIYAIPDPYEAYTEDQLYEFLLNHTLKYTPGTKRAYSNLGVALLGRLLGNAKGMRYEDLLTERILQPLKMGSTSISLNEDQLSRLVPGHDTYLQPIRTWEMSILPASGSLRSSVSDMLKLMSEYLGFTDSSLKSAMDRQLSERIPIENGWQALGWVIRSDGIIRHAGGKQGYRSGIAINLDDGIGAVVLSNARTYDQPINIALHLVSGEQLDPAPAAPNAKSRITIPRTVMKKYAGKYKFEDNTVFEIAPRDSHLLIRYTGGAILEFFASEENEFYYIAGNDEVTFESDDTGRVIGLKLYGDGKTSENVRSAAKISN